MGLSLALMAPSMAANINPQGAAGAGRAVPLAFLIAAVGVVYVLAVIGMTWLVFVRRAMPSVPMWQVIIPVAGLVVLGYTIYRNVWPYPSGDFAWFPIVAGIWLAVAVIGVLVAPRMARRLGAALMSREGISR